MRPPLTQEQFEKSFWNRVVKTDTCWIWSGKRNTQGYGIVYTHDRENVRAHRLSWKLTHGRDPIGLLCHTCDNPSCVRPDHLFEGSHSDNSRDMVTKKRSASGERHSQATLTDYHVEMIRRLWLHGATQTQLALQFNASSATISRICNRKTRV